MQITFLVILKCNQLKSIGGISVKSVVCLKFNWNIWSVFVMLLKIVKDLPIFMCCFIHQSGFSDSSVGKKICQCSPWRTPQIILPDVRIWLSFFKEVIHDLKDVLAHIVLHIFWVPVACYCRWFNVD